MIQQNTLIEQKKLQLKGSVKVVKYHNNLLACASGLTLTIFNSEKQFAIEATYNFNFITTAVNWSTDGNYLMCLTTGNEVTYANIKTASIQKELAVFNNMAWDTLNFAQCESNIGILTKYKKLEEIIVCKKIQIKGNSLTVVGDCYGMIRAYNYPSVSQQCKSCLFSGHSYPINDIECFDDGIMSIDEKGCIIKWVVQ